MIIFAWADFASVLENIRIMTVYANYDEEPVHGKLGVVHGAGSRMY